MPAAAIAAGEGELALSRAGGNLLALTHIYTSTLVLGIGALFGMLQAFSRASLITMPPAFDYYRMLTAHGVLMALVFTTFFITGLFTYAVYRHDPARAIVDAGLDRLLHDARRHRDDDHRDPERRRDRTLHVLRTAQSEPVLLSRRDAARARHLVRGLRLHLQRGVVQTSRTRPNASRYRRSWRRRRWSCGSSRRSASSRRCCSCSRGRSAGRRASTSSSRRMLFWYFGHPLVYFWIMGAYTIWYTLRSDHVRREDRSAMR